MKISLIVFSFLISFAVPELLEIGEDGDGPIVGTAQDYILPKPDEIFLTKGKERSKRKHAQQLLDDLFKALNGFGSYTSFSMDRFESDLELLVFHIIETEIVIKSLGPDNQELISQNDFSQNVFETFMNARSLHGQFPPHLNQDHRVLYDLVSLNLSLFKLRKQDGTLDPSTKHFVGLVRVLARRTEQIITQFGSSGEIPKVLDSVIQVQINEIQKNLQELALYFPLREDYVEHGTLWQKVRK